MITGGYVRKFKSPRITLRGKTVPIANVHEAGHALAYLLTRRSWGHEEPIERIEMGGERWIPMANGNQFLSGGTTYGPTFTHAMAKVPGNQFPPGDYNKADLYRCVIERSRAVGLDIETWARGYIFSCLAGPVAEAIFLGRHPWDVVMSEQSETDRNDAVLAFLCWRDLTAPAGHEWEMMAALDSAVDIAVTLVNRNRKAISALAVALPRSGVFRGRRATQILMKYLVAPDRARLRPS